MKFTLPSHIKFTPFEELPFLKKEDLKAFEEKYHLKIPADYFAFMLCHNGGRLKECLTSFVEDGKFNSTYVRHLFALKALKKYHDLNDVMESYQDRIPLKFLPIGEDPFGNLIIMNCNPAETPKIYFWNHELEADAMEEDQPYFENLSWIADSFTDFLCSLKNQ